MALGKAFIEIHADTRPFNKELERLLGVALREAEAAVRKPAQRVGEQISESTAKGVRAKGRRIRDAVEDEVKKVRPKVDIDIDDRGGFRRLFGSVRRLGSELTDAFIDVTKPIFNLFRTLGDAFRTSVANIVNIPANSPLATFLAIAVTVLLPAFIGLVTLAAAAVSDLVGFIGLIPGALFVVLGVIAPLIIAFQGLGEAIEAVFEKDPDKLKEKLKGLAPFARELVLSFKRLLPLFDSLRKSVQDAFFRPIVATLEPALRRILPFLQVGLTRVAAALGGLFAGFATLLEKREFLSFVQDLFVSIERMVQTLGPSLIALFQAITNMAHASLPFIELMVSKFSTFIKNFSDFVDEKVKNGDFEEFLEDAVRAFDNLVGLGEALFGLLGVIFDEMEAEGQGLLELFTKLIEDLTAFFESPEGKEFLEDLANAALLFVQILRDSLPVILRLLDVVLKIVAGFEAVQLLINRILKGINTILGKSTGVGSAVNSAAAAAARSVAGFDTGGIVKKFTFATLAESGPEAVIPLNQPQRAAEIMQEAGIGGIGPVTVIAQFGTETLEARAVRVFDSKLGEQTRSFMYGPRPG